MTKLYYLKTERTTLPNNKNLNHPAEKGQETCVYGELTHQDAFRYRILYTGFMTLPEMDTGLIRLPDLLYMIFIVMNFTVRIPATKV